MKYKSKGDVKEKEKVGWVLRTLKLLIWRY